MLIRDSTSINFSKFSKRYIYLLTPGSTWLSIFTTVSGRYTYSGRYVNWISIICPVGTFIPVGTTIQDLRVQLYKYIFMTSLMTSPGNKIGQILKLIYLRQYLSYSVDQMLKMLEMLMAIVLVYSTSGIKLQVKKVCRELKMAAILKNLKY